MLRRLIVGVVLGLVVGGLLAAAFVEGLKMTTFDGEAGALLAYVAASVTGVLTGLVAGRPIWASGAGIEAGLKAFFGALLAAGLMFALRRWGAGVPLDLSAIGAGAGPAALMPAASLPAIGLVLGVLFELDNTGEPASSAAARKRVAPPAARVAESKGAVGAKRVRASAEEEADDAPLGTRGAKR